MATQEAATREYRGGEVVKFRGYSMPLEEGQDPLLSEGESLKVTKVNDDGGLVCVVLGEDGEVAKGRQGDTVFPEEVEFVSEAKKQAGARKAKDGTQAETAEASGSKSTAKKAPTKKAAAKKAPAKKAAAKKSTAKKAAAKKAADDEAQTGIEDGVPVEVGGKDTTKTVSQAAIKHDKAVAALIEKEGALKAAKHLVNDAEEVGFMLGGVLAEIKSKDLHLDAGFEGTKGFNDYVEQELGIEYRKARYLINIYEVFRDPRIAKKLTAAKLKQIGWTKARLLARLGADQLVEHWDAIWAFATANTRSDLEAHIRSTYQIVTRDDAERVQVTKMSFKLVGDAAQTVERALSRAKDLVGEDDGNKALEYICGEWLNMTENVDAA